jgi:hypothetical protein
MLDFSKFNVTIHRLSEARWLMVFVVPLEILGSPVGESQSWKPPSVKNGYPRAERARVTPVVSLVP